MSLLVPPGQSTAPSRELREEDKVEAWGSGEF